VFSDIGEDLKQCNFYGALNALKTLHPDASAEVHAQMTLLSRDLNAKRLVWEPVLDSVELDPAAHRLSDVAQHLHRVARGLEPNSGRAESVRHYAVSMLDNAAAGVGTVQIVAENVSIDKMYNNCETNMEFNQTNENVRDVNNAISERGDVIQTVGTRNTIETKPRKVRLWDTVWSTIKACWKWLRG
jgi:hypothetical protein